jgi:hypothetical protein
VELAREVTVSDSWIKVWLQGGPVEDWHYFTLVEPPEEITIIRDPFHDGWIHVIGPWPGAIRYRREEGVEQFDFERIYYPLGDV